MLREKSRLEAELDRLDTLKNCHASMLDWQEMAQELSGGAEIKEGGDAEAIKSKMEEMSQKIYAIFGKLYQQEGGQPGADAGNGAGPQVNDDGTIDADAEVK